MKENKRERKVDLRLSEEELRELAWLTGYLSSKKSKVMRDALKEYYNKHYDFFLNNEF